MIRCGFSWSSGIHPARLSQAEKCDAYLSLFLGGTTARIKICYSAYEIVCRSRSPEPVYMV